MVIVGALLASPLIALNTPPTQAAVAAPAADVALVKAMFNTGRLSAGSDSQAGEPLASLQAYAAGTIKTHTPDHTIMYCTIDHVILQALYYVIVTRGFSLHISSINRRCENPAATNPIYNVYPERAYQSWHWENGGGHAIDVTTINGQSQMHNTALVQSYLDALGAVMPANSNTKLGQPDCWSGIDIPSGWGTVPDNCDSVHVEYRGASTQIISAGSFDYNSDGNDDFLAVRNDGILFLYKGTGAATFTGVQAGNGWGTMSNIVHGDFNGDGNGDIIASDATGALWFYPGDGSGGWNARQSKGAGWQTLSLVAGGADYNSDGNADLIARKADNTLWLYPGNGVGGFSQSQQVGNGWGGFTTLMSGDFNNDGNGDIEAVDSAGTLWFYPGDGAGGWTRS